MNAQYNKSTLKTVAINLNLTSQYAINDKSSLLLGAGAWQELNRNNMSLSGISDIPYMEEFNIENPLRRNKFRPHLSLGYSYNPSNNSAIHTNFRVIKDPFFNSANLGATASYSVRF